MEGITNLGGDLSEDGKARMAILKKKHEERLGRLVEDARNSIIEKSIDGAIKITIPNLGVITWASDIEDVKVAITEVVEAFKINSDKHGDGFEKELEKVYK